MAKRTIFAVLCVFIQHSSQSIAGITYMDNFDFEERYRDLHECDPFYWHPLHLPEECAEMFEKLIRSRIASKHPVRVVTKKKRDKYRYDSSVHYPYGQFVLADIGRPMTPYEEMLEQVKTDVWNIPAAPKIIASPYLGAVALYQQPISKKSENMIKKVSKLYGEATKDFNYPYQVPNVYSGYSEGNGEKNKNDKKYETNEMAENETMKLLIPEKNRRSKRYKTKTKVKKGHVITIIKS